MAYAVHFLNKPDETGRPRLLTMVVKGVSYRTCCWKLSEEDAARLVGCWVYLHDKKDEAARIGGTVTLIEPVTEPEFADQGRYALTFTSRAEAKKVRWRGASHAMAWTSGVILGKHQHEEA